MMKVISIALVLLTFSGNCQTVSKTEMQTVLISINKAYSGNKAYSMRVEHSSYAGHNDNTPVEIQKGSYLKSGQNYYSELLGIQTIQNKKAKLVIAKQQKQLIMSDKEELENSVVDKNQLSHILDQSETIQKTMVGSNTRYKITLKDGEMESYTIEVNKDFFIVELGLYYRQERQWKNEQGKTLKGKPKLLVKYSNIKMNPNIDENKFAFSKYLTISDKEYKPVSTYKSYTFNDNRIHVK